MLIALLVVVGAVAQAASGLGFGLICAPFLIGQYGPVEGVQQVVLLSLLLNATFLVGQVHHVRGREVVALLIPALIAAPLLAHGLKHVPTSVLLVTAGTLTILAALLLWRDLRWTWLSGTPGAVVAGLISAAMNVLGGLAGPAVAMYAVNAAWPASSVRPTLQLYGLGLNIVTLLSLGLPPLRGPLLLGLVGGLILGLSVSRSLPQQSLRPLILGLATVGGVLVIVRGLIG